MAQMIFVHFSEDELKYLDVLQGGPSFDDEWQIREYSALSPLFKDKQFINLLVEVLGEIAETGDVEYQIEKLHNTMGDEPIEFIDAPGDFNPEIKAIADLGEEGDSKLALIPEDVRDTLVAIVGDKKNSQTGLNEFFFPIIAGLFAGAAAGAAGAATLGTALATGIGTFAGSKLMGHKTKHALRSGLFAGIGAGVAPTIGSTFAKHFPAAAGTFRNLSNATLGTNLTSSLAPMFGGTNNADKEEENLASQVDDNMTESATKLASKQKNKGLFNNPEGMFGNTNIPMMLLSGAYLNKQATKQQKQYERDKLEHDRRVSDYFKNDSKSLFPVVEAKKYIPEYSSNNLPYGKFKKGGLVHGKEKGQKDNRPFTIEEGAYIVNATNLSDLGDGNSLAGDKEVNKFLGQYRPIKDGKKEKLKVLLSDGEKKIDRDLVTAIGRGSNERGAKMLDKAFKSLRGHKISNGLALPPKAKALKEYI